MQLREIRLGSDLRQLAGHGTPMFPAAMYYSNMDEFVTGEVPWHWHEEVEFTINARGTLQIDLAEETLRLGVGDGAFVNSNMLHALRKATEEPCEFLTVAFDPSLISGAPGSVFEQKYVLPLVHHRGLEVLSLSPEVAWQKEVLSLLSRAYRVYEEKRFGYELELQAFFANVWGILARALQDTLGEKKMDAGHARIMTMLGYIHEHYGRDISLEGIADSAGVSESECCRCFKSKLGLTPFQYLLDYRVRVAARLLKDTDMPVTEICYEVGFNSPSYFGKVFREATGYSPRAYRQEG